MQEKHEHALAAAVDEYERTRNAHKEAAARLVDAVRAAYADGEPQAAILRGARHIWTREYLRVLLGLTKKRGGPEDAPK